MIRQLLLLLTLASCATNKPEGLKVREIPLDSPARAKAVITNQVKFLKMLFEQSRDPYYGTLKWTEACLRENKIGEVSEEKNVVISRSELFLDEKGNAGFCPGTRATLHHVIYLHCPGDKVVKEIKQVVSGQKLLPGDALCD